MLARAARLEKRAGKPAGISPAYARYVGHPPAGVSAAEWTTTLTVLSRYNKSPAGVSDAELASAHVVLSKAKWPKTASALASTMAARSPAMAKAGPAMAKAKVGPPAGAGPARTPAMKPSGLSPKETAFLASALGALTAGAILSVTEIEAARKAAVKSGDQQKIAMLDEALAQRKAEQARIAREDAGPARGPIATTAPVAPKAPAGPAGPAPGPVKPPPDTIAEQTIPPTNNQIAASAKQVGAPQAKVKEVTDARAAGNPEAMALMNRGAILHGQLTSRNPDVRAAAQRELADLTVRSSHDPEAQAALTGLAAADAAERAYVDKTPPVTQAGLRTPRRTSARCR